MVVDDSAVIRGMITRILESDPNIKVTASAQNGEVALGQYERQKPDVVIMDIEMPVMDGITALGKLIKAHPNAKVIMCSTLTLQNAEISMRAMQIGAVDYIPKPTSSTEINSSSVFHARVIELVRAFGKPRGAGKSDPVPSVAPSAIPQTVKSEAKGGFILPPTGAKFALRPEPPATWRPRILAVGSSTGGPQALFEFFKPLKGIKNVPVVITQHMPPTFTAILAQHITQQTGVPCVEAEEGMPLLPGRAHVARGGLHMLVKKNDQGQMVLTLDDGAPENFCKPAVDPMLRSLIPHYSRDILTVILTGMGSDGMLGAKAVVEAGGCAYAQDQASSVVWGMPGATAMAGICAAVLPLKDIGGHVARRVL
ncbi:MAG: chemotaxis response regulator protein-glutamate methylesterase [Rhodospirillales bacterium]|nr:chemotaxis response regulator protein-glutamate methylesterase [Alphaproteobacteria bacterium]MCB9987064.1 chemotaxis response regulator protein-glutamate methylesterase [Rhodospirillales bacterium]USO08569.1 MAG: chemotaxis response regulator protein-glutamate methylesterase [Rhodospirillales bacterium]